MIALIVCSLSGPNRQASYNQAARNIAIEVTEIESFEQISNQENQIKVTLKSGRTHVIEMSFEKFTTAIQRMDSPLLRQ